MLRFDKIKRRFRKSKRRFGKMKRRFGKKKQYFVKLFSAKVRYFFCLKGIFRHRAVLFLGISL